VSQPAAAQSTQIKQSTLEPGEWDMANSLCERLGGSDAIQRTANDSLDIHAPNPRVARRFVDSALPNVYEGKDMIAVHKGMNIDNDEFMAVLNNAVAALTKIMWATGKRRSAVYPLQHAG